MKFWQRARRWLYLRIARTVWGEEPGQEVPLAEAGTPSPILPEQGEPQPAGEGQSACEPLEEPIGEAGGLEASPPPPGDAPAERFAPADAADASEELLPLWEYPPGEALEWEFRRRWAALTLRERQVLRLYLAHSEEEFLNAYQVARELGITRATLRTHLHRAYRKLGIHSRRELVDLRELIEGRGTAPG
jgi:DNA-binding CsgD family transcriptional regulator